MTQLTPEQRAKRRANKRNKRLVRDMPLFAEALTPDGTMADWLTTPEKELPAVLRNVEAAKRFGEEIRRRMAEETKQETELRAQAIAGKSDEDIAFLDARRQAYPESGSYGVTFWKKVLNDPNWISAKRDEFERLRRLGITNGWRKE